MKKTNAYFSDLKMWSNMTQSPSPQFKWHDGKEIIYQHILSQIYCHNSFGEIMFQYYKKNKMHYIEDLETESYLITFLNLKNMH